jgi:hypothetical protein
MTLLVPDMIDPKLPGDFLFSAAYGDLLEGRAGSRFDLCFAEQLAFRHSSGVGDQHVGIRGPAKRSARRLAVERAELQPSHHLVYLYVLRSLGTCFTSDDLLDFDQVQVLEQIRLRNR